MSYSQATAGSSGQLASTHRVGETDWSDPDQIAKAAEAVWVGRFNPQKERAEAQAYRNLKFVAGDQWSRWDPKRHEMVDNDYDIAGANPKPTWEKQLVFNRCMAAVEMRLAKFMRAEGTPDPIPITDDPDDVAKAQATADMVRAYWDEILDMPAVMAGLYLAGEITKTAFLKVSWDRALGDPKSVNLETFFNHPDRPPVADGMEWAQQQMAELYGQQAADDGNWSGKTGDVQIKRRSIFDINVWPFNATEFGSSPSDFGHVQVLLDTYEMTAYEVAELLDLSPEDVRSIAKQSADDEALRSRMGRAEWQSAGYGGRYDRDNDSVRVHEIYRVPCRDFPKGRMAYVIGKTCCAEWVHDLNVCDAYKRPILPYFHYTSKRVPELLWGRCTVDDLIDPQRERNAAASQEANFRNSVVMPHLFRIQGDELGDGEMSNSPGGQSEIPGAEYMPRFLERPSLGPEHTRTFERATQEIYEISGIGQIDYGGVEGGNPKAGVAINALTENNDLRMIPSATFADKLACKVFESVAYLVMEFGADERVVNLMGNQNSRDLGDFRGKEIRFTGQNLRPTTWDKPGRRIAMLSFQSYRNLPSTRGETTRLIDGLSAGKWLNPMDPDDKSAVLRMVGIGSARGYIDRDRKHIAKQQAEIDLWRSGQPVGPPNKTDRHKVHVDQLREWMATEEWDALVIQAPETANEAVQHLELHLTGMAYDAQKPLFEKVYATAQLTTEFRQRAIATNMPELAMLFASPMPFLGMPMAPTGTPEGAGGAHNQAEAPAQGHPGGNGQPQHAAMPQGQGQHQMQPQ